MTKKATRAKYTSTTSGRTKRRPTRNAKASSRTTNKRAAATVTLSSSSSIQEFRIPSPVLRRITKELEPYQVMPDEPDGSIDELKKKLSRGKPAWAVHFRGIREREGLTQKQIAEALGLSQSNVSEIEHAKRPIGKTLAKRIATEFDCDYRLFL